MENDSLVRRRKFTIRAEIYRTQSQIHELDSYISFFSIKSS